MLRWQFVLYELGVGMTTLWCRPQVIVGECVRRQVALLLGQRPGRTSTGSHKYNNVLTVIRF